jgi:predicted O-linked N-acetylglucosamine transferase (SPINDLY family)
MKRKNKKYPSAHEMQALLDFYNTQEFNDTLNRAKDFIRRFPHEVLGWKILGSVYQKLGQLQDSLSCKQKTVALLPSDPEAHNNLGNVYLDLGRYDDALDCFNKSIALKPNFAQAYANQGTVLQKLERYRAALESNERAIALNPNLPEAHNGRGACLYLLNPEDSAAESCFNQAIALKPDYAEAYGNLGSSLLMQLNFVAAELFLRRALAINPQVTEARFALACTLVELDQHEEARGIFKQVLAIKSDEISYNIFLFKTNYHPDISAEEIYADYKAFNQQFCLPVKKDWQPHTNSRDTKRRLKVGYVSPDFKQHSVAMFLMPLLAHHNPELVEIYAYSQVDVDKEDAMTSQLKTYVAHWVTTTALSDNALAQRIRDDGIDILVDLAGHTAGNRLMVFARKPAPVSVSMLGYGYTTGLEAIDYYLTDATTVPLGSEHLFSESLWHLPCAFGCRPSVRMGGEVNLLLPAVLNGYVTFGTLTRSIRINHRTVRVWSAILKALPNAKLVVNSGSFKFKASQAELEERFALHGILPHQLIIGYESPPWNVLRGMDISLDCFPHNSGTTLIESLYMGVPFITLADRPSVGRIGSSALVAINHPEWIATTEAAYIQKAITLASDISKLANIRVKLRQEMEDSPMINESYYAQNVEKAYQAMFKRWSEQSQ